MSNQKSQCLNDFNTFYFNYFNNLSNKSKLKGSQMSTIYKSVSDSIRKFPFPIVNSFQISILHKVGNTISKKFENLIEEYKKQLKLEWKDKEKSIILSNLINNIDINQKTLMNNIKFSKKKYESLNSLNSEMRKNKRIINILPYSSIWTNIISSYLIYLQTGSFSMTVNEVIDNSLLLQQQFDGVISLSPSQLDDFQIVRNFGFLLKESNFKTGEIVYCHSIKEFSIMELSKSGINIDVSNENEVNISLDDNYYLAVNNRIINNKIEIEKETSMSFCDKELKIIDNILNPIELTNQINQIQTTLDTSILNSNKELSEIENKFRDFISQSDESMISQSIQLVIDSRELSHQGIPSKHFENLLITMGIKAKSVLLSVGDILWVYKGSDNIEFVLDFIIERKTLDDLAASINDGRYKEQKVRLKSSGLKNIYYLIEGIKYENRHINISNQAIQNSIFNTLTVHDINIIRTDSQKQSVEMILEMDRNIRKYYLYKYKSFKSNRIQEKDEEENEIIKSFFTNSLIFNDFQQKNSKNRNLTIENIFKKQLSCFDSFGIKALEIFGRWFRCTKDLINFIRIIENPEKKVFYFNMLSVVNEIEELNFNKNDFLGTKENIDLLIKMVDDEKYYKKIKKKLFSKNINQKTIESIIRFYSL